MGAASSAPYVPVVSEVVDVTTDAMEFSEPIARDVADVLEYIPTPKAQYGAIMLDTSADMSEDIRKDDRRDMLTNVGKYRSARKQAKLNTADIYGGYFDELTGETYYQDLRDFHDKVTNYRPSFGNNDEIQRDDQRDDQQRPIDPRSPLDRTRVPRRFPASWGRPPDVPNAKQVPLPFNLGFGSTNLRDWIVEKSGGVSPLRGKPTSRFPSSWGDVPLYQTKDLVTLPGGYGQGSSTLANWISENMNPTSGVSKPSVTGQFKGGGAVTQRNAAPQRRDSDRRSGRTYRAMDTYVYPPKVRKLGSTFMTNQARITDVSKSLKDELTVIQYMLNDALDSDEQDQGLYVESVFDEVNDEVFTWYNSRKQSKFDENIKTTAYNFKLKIEEVLYFLSFQKTSVQSMRELYEHKIGSDVSTTPVLFLEQNNEWLGDVLTFLSRLIPILENHVARLRSFELHNDAMRETLRAFDRSVKEARFFNFKNGPSLGYLFREYDIDNFNLQGNRINTQIDDISFESGLGDIKMLDKLLATQMPQNINALRETMLSFLDLLRGHSASIIRLLATRL